MRWTGNPIVLSFPNLGQLIDRYGESVAHTIFSQPLNKFILRTSDGDSAKKLERLIGDIEVRRFRENRSGSVFGFGDRNSFSGPEDSNKVPVMASQIQALPDLEGYFVQRGQIVKIKLPYIARPEKSPAWIERRIPPHVPSNPAAYTPIEAPAQAPAMPTAAAYARSVQKSTVALTQFLP
jgi:type IV secretory pathway TraG/TraD family ATPase VirD4